MNAKVNTAVRHPEKTAELGALLTAYLDEIGAIASGATATASFAIPVAQFRYWDEKKGDYAVAPGDYVVAPGDYVVAPGDYVVAPGDYVVEVGAASDDIRQSVSLKVSGK